MTQEERFSLIKQTKEKLIENKSYNSPGSIYYELRDKLLTPFPKSLQRAKDKQQELIAQYGSIESAQYNSKKDLGSCDRHPAKHAYCGLCEEIRWEEEEMLLFDCSRTASEDTRELDDLKSKNAQSMKEYHDKLRYKSIA